MLNECNGCEYQCNLSHIDICTLGSPCPHQRSTPMTNEEWLRTLPADERVKEILFRGFMTEKRTAEEFVKWLEEKHKNDIR